jgi:hypothetical protein
MVLQMPICGQYLNQWYPPDLLFPLILRELFIDVLTLFFD